MPSQSGLLSCIDFTARSHGWANAAIELFPVARRLLPSVATGLDTAAIGSKQCRIAQHQRVSTDPATTAAPHMPDGACTYIVLLAKDLAVTASSNSCFRPWYPMPCDVSSRDRVSQPVRWRRIRYPVCVMHVSTEQHPRRAVPAYGRHLGDCSYYACAMRASSFRPIDCQRCQISARRALSYMDISWVPLMHRRCRHCRAGERKTAHQSSSCRHSATPVIESF